MILPLQRRHRIIWTIIALLLPLLFVAALLSIPQPSENPASDYSYELYPNQYNELQDEHFKITERKLETSDSILYQIVIEVKQPLREAATSIYITEMASTDVDNFDTSMRNAIGQVFSKGTYIFELFDPLQTNDGLVFYNPITQKVVHTLTNN